MCPTVGPTIFIIGLQQRVLVEFLRLFCFDLSVNATNISENTQPSFDIDDFTSG